MTLSGLPYDINNRTAGQKLEELSFAYIAGCYEGAIAERVLDEINRLSCIVIASAQEVAK